MSSDEPAVKRMKIEDNYFEDELSFYEKIPQEIWENVFYNFKYEKIAELRLVCKQFNKICDKILKKARLKVEQELAQRLKFVRSEIIKFNFRTYAKYNFVYLIHSYVNQFCKLFREFVGKNKQCFTLGKITDLLIKFFQVLDIHELRRNRNDTMDYTCLLEAWRETYDKYQMKNISEFDYCLSMWLEYGQKCFKICDPSAKVLKPSNLEEWINDVGYLDTCASSDIENLNYYYTESFVPSNKHWTFRKPPPMDDQRLIMLTKHLIKMR